MEQLVQEVDEGRILQSDIDRISFDDNQVLFVGTELQYAGSAIRVASVQNHGTYLAVKVEIYEQRE